MITIAEAWKTRWDAKSLDSQITGSISQSWSAERNTMPYACYSEISAAGSGRSVSSRYTRSIVQIDVYAATPDDAGRLAKVIRDAFNNSNRAATNPFELGSGFVVKRIESDGAPIESQEGPEVFRSMQTFEIEWAENRSLTPAS